MGGGAAIEKKYVPLPALFNYFILYYGKENDNRSN
jgi:hypothetical protein